MTTASQIKFGIEIECTVPRNNVTFAIGGYHHGIEVSVSGTSGWKAEKDCSIQTISGRIGVEFVSPILQGAEGLAQVLAMLQWLNDIGAKVNRSCGLHITTSFDVCDVKAMRRLIHFTARHEDAIWASTGSKWRQSAESTYARDIKHAFKPLEGLDKDVQTHDMRYSCNSRYFGLNLSHAFRGRNRIEFRYFAGTLNDVKMAGYIQMVLGIVQRATNGTTTPKWDGATDNNWNGVKVNKGAGEGRKALYQLVYELKWVQAKNSETSFGLLGSREDAAASRKELMRMATKYDAS